MYQKDLEMKNKYGWLYNWELTSPGITSNSMVSKRKHSLKHLHKHCAIYTGLVHLYRVEPRKVKRIKVIKSESLEAIRSGSTSEPRYNIPEKYLKVTLIPYQITRGGEVAEPYEYYSDSNEENDSKFYSDDLALAFSDKSPSNREAEPNMSFVQDFNQEQQQQEQQQQLQHQ